MKITTYAYQKRPKARITYWRKVEDNGKIKYEAKINEEDGYFPTHKALYEYAAKRGQEVTQWQ